MKVLVVGGGGREHSLVWKIVNAGGRVLGVTALGDTIKNARDLAYNAVDKISWEGSYYRNDIGYRVLEREV
jgi:phosphoribosylamine--glycine ligase